jgi:hypothetical protein
VWSKRTLGFERPWRRNVRYWHKADITRLSSNVRYWG